MFKAEMWGKVRKLALECIPDKEILRIVREYQGDAISMQAVDEAYLETAAKKLKDFMGVYYICRTIVNVENALFHKQYKMAEMETKGLQEILQSNAYQKEPFKDNPECEEALARKELLNALTQAVIA